MADERKRQTSMSEFKSLGPADSALVERLTKDKQRPHVKLSSTDITALSPVFRRNIRNATDAENIMKVLPFIKLAKDILVSSIISPGDLVKHELNLGTALKGVNTQLLMQLDKIVSKLLFQDKKMSSNVPDWIEEALVLRGSHPILIIPQASLDKMMGRGNYSTEEFKSLIDDNENYRHLPPKGILKRPEFSAEYLSMESACSGNVDPNQLLHTIQIPASRFTQRQTGSHSLPVTVTDNLNIIARPELRDAVMGAKYRSAYGVPAFEAAVAAAKDKDKDADLEGKQAKDETEKEDAKAAPTTVKAAEVYSKYFRTDNGSFKRLVVMPSSSREDNAAMSHPIEYHLPPECVAPAFNPGEPEKPIGFWIAFDLNGYPASYLNRIDYYDDIRNGYIETGMGSQQAGAMLNLAKEIKSGSVREFNNLELDRLQQLNSDIMERDLIARLGSLIKGDSIEIGMTDAFNKMMFARQMKNQHTTLLYVPAEFMIYFAFEYTPFGVGKSILEDAKEHAAMLAALKIAMVHQALKNAIPGKDINVKLDADDTSPQETLIEQLNEAISLSFHHIPVNISSTADISSQLQNSAWNINVEGNERYPDMKTTITDRERVADNMDTALQEQMKEELYNALGLTADMINNINQPEFAITAVQQSILLRKRVVTAQTKANPHLSNYGRVFIMNSGIACTELLEVLKANAKQIPKEYEGNLVKFLEDYINSLTITLPEPIVDDMEHKSDLIEKFTTALDKVLPAYIEQTFFTGYDPEEYKTQIEQVTAAYRGLAIRNWLRKHSIMPEVEMFGTDEDGNISFAALDEMYDHTNNLNLALGKWIERQANGQKDRMASVKKALKADGAAAERIEDAQRGPSESEGIVAADGGDEPLGNSQTGELEETGEESIDFNDQVETDDAPADAPADDESDDTKEDTDTPDDDIPTV